jgi:nitrate reductase gamma subunit
MRKLIAPESMAGLFGLAFVAVGVAGFVPGVVDHYEQLGWWKNGSGAQLLGVFQVSILLNLLHLGSGTLGLLLARTTATARAYLSGGGAAYLALGVYGLLIDRAGDANVVPVDRADDWLHLGLGVAMLYAGLAAALPGLRPVLSS